MYNLFINYTCNAAKNETNIRERGLPLLAARALFNDTLRVREDTRKPYPERCFIGYGRLDGRLMVVVFCHPAPDSTHIISFRKANHREQKLYATETL